MSDIIQRAFNAGEVPEDFWLRNDLEWFNRSVRVCKNFIPSAKGPLVNRPGLKYIGELGFKPDLLRRDALDGYVLAFGKDSASATLNVGWINSSASFIYLFTAGSQPSPCIPYDFVPCDLPKVGASKYYGGVLSYSDIGVSVGEDSYGQRLQEVRPSVGTAVEATDLNYGMSAPSIVVAIPGAGTIPVYYQVSTVDVNGVETLPSTIGSDTGDALAATNPATITWNEPAYGGFSVTKYYVYRVESGISRFIGDVTATAAAAPKTFVDYAFDRDVNLGPINRSIGTSIFPYQYGNSVCLHQQRLISGNRSAYVASRVGSPFSLYYGAPIADADSFRAKMTEIQVIYYVRSVGGELLVFERNGVWAARGDNTGALVPSSSGATLRWYEQVKEVAPEISKSGIFFAVGNYDIRFIERNPSGGDGYTSHNLSEHSYALNYGEQLTSLSSQNGREDVVWSFVKGASGQYTLDRSWRSCTIAKGTDIVAWSHHVTDGEVLVSCDDVFIVKRTINGGTKYYVEMLSDRIDDRVNGIFLDCYKTYASPTVNVTGLGHLEAKEVYAIVDGIKYGPYTVSGGNITLDETGTVVHIGLAYDSLMTTQDVDLIGQSTLGRQVKATSAVNVWVKNSTGGEVRVNNGDWQEIRLRDESDDYGGTALRTGLTEDIHVSTSPSREQTVSVRQTEPFPFSIVGIVRSVKGA